MNELVISLNRISDITKYITFANNTNVYSLINFFPLSILGKNFSRRHFAIFLLFYPENRLCKIVADNFFFFFFVIIFPKK